MTDTSNGTTLPARSPVQSRRQFVKGAAGLALGGLLLPLGYSAVSHRSLNPWAAAPSLNFAGFHAHLGSRFRVRTAEKKTLNMTLAEATQWQLPVSDGSMLGGEHFTLVFQGPKDHLLTQDNYRFQHGQLGTFELFIVPGQPGENASRYAAIISRLEA